VDLEPSRPGAAAKVLSRDEVDGARTVLLRYPPGYALAAQAVAADEEWFVLDGDIGCGSATLGRHGYAWWPARQRRASLRSLRGAVVLTMWSSEPAIAPGSMAAAQGAQSIVIPDTFDRPWQYGAEGSVTGKPLSAGIATKILRRDARSGEQSFLYAALPQHPPPAVMPGKFAHPVIEEIFVIYGSYVFGDVGRMGPGGYAFWRENQYHGPAGSESGYLLLIRVLGGALSNVFSREPAPFSYHPAYRPVLPEALSALAREYQPATDW
jgi:hypothetical protein